MPLRTPPRKRGPPESLPSPDEARAVGDARLSATVEHRNGSPSGVGALPRRGSCWRRGPPLPLDAMATRVGISCSAAVPKMLIPRRQRCQWQATAVTAPPNHPALLLMRHVSPSKTCPAHEVMPVVCRGHHGHPHPSPGCSRQALLTSQGFGGVARRPQRPPRPLLIAA